MGATCRHPPETRQAIEVLLTTTTLSMKDIAAREGVPYETVRNWNLRMPVRARVHGRHALPSLAALNAALRAHIGRQIAAFDLRLRERAEAPDAGRVLRDLAGLKRLLDELGADAAKHAAIDGEADGESPKDIAAFRAEIARRYAAFEAAEADRAVSDEPAPGIAEAPGR